MPLQFALSVYALSGLTAVLCSILLLRAYRRTWVRLLFWAGVCFVALALESVVLIVNEFTTQDLTVLRLLVPLVGLFALLYGLLWESESR